MVPSLNCLHSDVPITLGQHAVTMHGIHCLNTSAETGRACTTFIETASENLLAPSSSRDRNVLEAY